MTFHDLLKKRSVAKPGMDNSGPPSLQLSATSLHGPHVSQIEFEETSSESVCCLNSPKQWALKISALHPMSSS